ncbi:MAG: exo-alpha-sialidase [Akkermansia sp.]|nr:exo-alpha-sialidase [Akkermansia sp.]
MSTICYSEDNGKTWKYGNGVPHSTSECQVVELQDGAIMIINLATINQTFLSSSSA